MSAFFQFIHSGTMMKFYPALLIGGVLGYYYSAAAGKAGRSSIRRYISGALLALFSACILLACVLDIRANCFHLFLPAAAGGAALFFYGRYLRALSPDDAQKVKLMRGILIVAAASCLSVTLVLIDNVVIGALSWIFKYLYKYILIGLWVIAAPVFRLLDKFINSASFWKFLFSLCLGGLCGYYWGKGSVEDEETARKDYAAKFFNFVAFVYVAYLIFVLFRNISANFLYSAVPSIAGAVVSGLLGTYCHSPKEGKRRFVKIFIWTFIVLGAAVCAGVAGYYLRASLASAGMCMGYVFKGAWSLLMVIIRPVWSVLAILLAFLYGLIGGIYSLILSGVLWFIRWASPFKTVLSVLVSVLAGYYFGMALSGNRKTRANLILTGAGCGLLAIAAVSALFVDSGANLFAFALPALVVMLAVSAGSYYYYTAQENRQYMFLRLRRLLLVLPVVLVVVFIGVAIRFNDDKALVIFLESNIGKIVLAAALGLGIGSFFGEAMISEHRKPGFRVWSCIFYVIILYMFLYPLKDLLLGGFAAAFNRDKMSDAGYLGFLLGWMAPGLLSLGAGILINIGKIRGAMARRKNVRLLAQHIILSFLGFIYLYPFLWLVGSSLKTARGFFSEGLNIIPRELQWDNYPRAWVDAMFGIYFKNTVIITASVVVLVVVISSMAAYTLSRTQFPGRKTLIGIVLVLMFAPAGYTLIPQYDLMDKVFHLNNTLYAVIILATSGALLWNSFMFMGYFLTIDKELEEAARVDGASFNQLYWRIMFPLAKPMIATVSINALIWNWNDFMLPLVFTLSKPELRTLAVGMYNFQSEHSTEWTLMCAAAVIGITPITLIFMCLQSLFIESLQGAIKG
ncbi:MAG: carbohydrate ABC transporter permease [Bacillota bacterium]